MTDTEILQWLVSHGAIDWPVLSYMNIIGADGNAEVRDRLWELRGPEGGEQWLS